MEKRNLRYTTFVGDGESSSFGRVHLVFPYSQEHTVQKEECVGHIQKRMGTCLREFVRSNKGKKVGGRAGVCGRGCVSRDRTYKPEKQTSE